MKEKAKKYLIKILIVEDEGVISLDLQSFLKGAGYGIAGVAASGREALEKVKASTGSARPDLVLMDIVLKGKTDGIETARKIHALYGIPSIFLTAYADEEKIERAKGAQPFGYILKPFKKEELEVAIEMALYRLSAEKKAGKEDAEHRKLAEELAKLSARQKSILSTVPDILMEVNSHKVYTWANKAGFEFFGKDVIGKEASYFFEGDQKTYDIVKPIFLGKEKTIYLESWQRRKDGQKRLLAWRCRPLKDKDGKVIGALSSAHDITERKRIEEAMKASELRYRRLFESAKDGILILDYETGKIVDVNPFLTQMLDFPKDKFVGKQLWQLGFFRDIVQNKANFLELKRKKIIRYENLPLETADGRKINVEFVSNVYNVNHRKVIQCNIRDITERRKTEEALKKSEKRYHDIFEGSQDALMLLDNKGFFHCNKATLKIFGYKTVKEFCTKHPGQVSPPTQPDGTPSMKLANKRIQDAYDKGSNLFEWIHRRKNGEDFPASVLLVAFELEGRKVLQATVRDITQQKKIEQGKMEMISLASHQLRTPPTGVKWFANMLLEEDVGPLNKKQRSYLNEIVYNNQRMIDLVHSLLNVSRIELGTFISTIDLKQIQIPKLIDDILDEFRTPIFDKLLVVIRNYAKGLPTVQADQSLLKIVLSNLISNAIHYASDRGRIKLAIGRQKSAMLVTISDTGCGIPKYQLSKIFSKFFRADNAVEKDSHGTGLGLYLTKKIVDEMGGTLEFKSVLNKGTTFYLAIPIHSRMKSMNS